MHYGTAGCGVQAVDTARVAAPLAGLGRCRFSTEDRMRVYGSLSRWVSLPSCLPKTLHFFSGIDNCKGKVWTGAVGPVACCLAQNAEKDSGDVGPDFSTPELAVLKPAKSRTLDSVFSRQHSKEREPMACLTKRKK